MLRITMVDSRSVVLVATLGVGCALGSFPASPATSFVAPELGSQREEEVAVRVPTGPVSLDELTSHARVHAPRWIVADAKRFGAEAELTAARQRALYNPVIRVALGARTQAQDTGLEAQAGISQRIEVAAERRKRIATAERLAAQVDREREATAWEVEVEVRRLYRLAAILDELTSLTEQAAVAAGELAEATRMKVDAGDEPPLAAELAVARAALIEANTQAMRAEHDAVIGRLAAASGWPPDAPLTLAPAPRPRAALPPDLALAELALEHNRDRASLTASVERATASRKLAKREAWPEPTIGARYGREAGVANNQAAHVALGVVNIPIPSFARNQAGQARARADERTSRAQLLAFERGIPGQVAEPAARVRGALGRMDALAAVSADRDARRLSALREAYDAGEIGLLQVLRALEQTIETRTAALAAEADYVNALANLERVVGTRLDEDGVRR